MHFLSISVVDVIVKGGWAFFSQPAVDGDPHCFVRHQWASRKPQKHCWKEQNEQKSGTLLCGFIQKRITVLFMTSYTREPFVDLKLHFCSSFIFITMDRKKVCKKSSAKKKMMSIELKRETIEKLEQGVRVVDLSRQYGRSTSMICSVLKRKESIKSRLRALR
ncbi:hypothetical protein TNIN_471771 [Trichonephila inaurata madagascariensis]|uniref:HTH psq-type domain-containing protein n=1 Tax=Trichonephila inaurata madagascariensis TaxID=2747483 RepID=A0A8X6XT23_9ARAC|nr:hypothetical protein TNIN_471771 [Trichonephila inaurata madagascariensis]